MILPTKHIDTESSLIGIGAELIKIIDRPKTVSTLWEQAKLIKGIKSYGTFTLALDFLYMMGIIDFKDGFVKRSS